MSLINQVLKNVEGRQGAAISDGWSGQIKPVLVQQAPASWWRRLIPVVLLIGLVVWMYLQWPVLMDWARLQQSGSQGKTLPPVLVAGAHAHEKESQRPPAERPRTNAAPQLTRTLFSDWRTQLDTPSQPAETPKIALQPKGVSPQVASQAMPAKVAALPQVEGEFMIKPVESTPATVVSAIEPPLVTTGTGKHKAQTEPESAKGLVQKQLRPEQEVNQLIQRALDHEQKGRMSEAMATLRQALVTYPQSEDARQWLAAYLFESKQDQEAITLLQTGIKQYPDQVNLSKSLAKWQLAHGQPEAVLSTMKPVAKAFSQDAESQWMMAMAYQQTGQHASALTHFERANTLRPGQAQWMVAYAISLQAAGQSAQALQQLQLAQSLPLSERLAEFVGQRIRQLGGSPLLQGD